MANQGFWFPTMKISEIAGALEEWGLSLTEEQIKRPTRDIVQMIYVLFLQQVTGITPESLQEPVNRSLAVAPEYPELYSNSLNLNLFLHHVQRLANAAQVGDFCMRDLIFPEPQRTTNILSAMINFIKFAEERSTFLKKLRDQSTLALEEKEEMTRKVAELKQKIAEIKKQREVDEPRRIALEKENEQIRKDMLAIQNAKTEVTREVDARKKDKRELTRRKEDLQREVELVASKVNTTRGRIVQSPERIKKHISEMSIMAQDERRVMSAAEERSKDLKTKLDALKVFEQDMKKLVDDLRTIHAEHIQVETVRHRLASWQEDLKRKLISKEELLGRAERAKRLERNALEKLARARQQAEERRLRAQEELQRLQREYAEMSEERKENDKMVEETTQEADALERKMKEHLRRNEAELNELLSEYWRLHHQTEVYMETLADKLGITVT